MHTPPLPNTIVFGGLLNNGNFVQYGQLHLGGKFEVNVGGAACDEESGTHSGIQSRTEGKEGKTSELFGRRTFRKTLTSKHQFTFN